MGSVESCPVLSQAKSLVQVITFDVDGALETHSIFIKRCPVVSQANSLTRASAAGVFGLMGDSDGMEDQMSKAKEAQVECADEVSGIINYVPVVGHVRAGVLYLQGDVQRGRAAVTSATHTTGQIIGTVLGGIAATTPVAVFLLAWAGWSLGGVAADSVVSEVVGEQQGVMKKIDAIVNVSDEVDDDSPTRSMSAEVFSVASEILLM